MYTFLVVLFVLLSFLMVVVILLQSGKGQGLAGSIGGGMAGQSMFGGRGAGDFLSKTTAYLATAYFLLAIIIGIYYKNTTEDIQKSLMQKQIEQQQALPSSDLPVAPIETAPEAPATDKPENK